MEKRNGMKLIAKDSGSFYFRGILNSNSFKHLLLAWLLMACIFPGALAQQTRKIGTVNDFFYTSHIESGRGAGFGLRKKTIPSAGKDLEVGINVSEATPAGNVVIGEVKDHKGSNVFFRMSQGKLEGTAVLPAARKAYSYYSDKEGDVFVEEVNIDKVLCIDYSKETTVSARETSPGLPASPDAYHLQSLPSAKAVVMLDFDGQYVAGTYWNGGNPITAQPASMTAGEISDIWSMVSEDYRPFNINITTDEAVYQAAPAAQRVRCIFTPTNTVAPGTGGISYVGSFTWGNETPCWVFNTGTKYAGEAASHEIGHTLGLSHDGRTNPQEEYYSGQGSWGPIMGTGYYKELVQWSRGEYAYASNTEDDIAIIAGSANGFGFRQDEAGSTFTSARQLTCSSSGSVDPVQNAGIISNQSDVDVYSFTTAGGTVSLDVSPSSLFTDLDLSVNLMNSQGVTVVSSGPATALNASLTVTLMAGTYYLTVAGTGNGTPASTGYSAYGSVGGYAVSGNIPMVPQAPSQLSVAITSPASGMGVSKGTTIAVAAKVSSSNTVSRVDFYDGSAFFASDVTAPYTVGFVSYTAGTHTLSAVAYDDQGNKATATGIINVFYPAYTAIVYKHCNYSTSGYAVKLGEGSYTRTQLSSKGVLNDDISSLKIVEGYEIVLYRDDNFGGPSVALRADDACLTDNKINDWASSLIVRAISNQPPSIQVVSPLTGTHLASGNNTIVDIIASDADGSISAVDFYTGAALMSSLASPPYRFTFSGDAPGEYVISAVATDNRGAKTRSGNTTIIVDQPGTATGITGPSCVAPGVGYTYTLNTGDVTATSVNWWTFDDVAITVDPADNRRASVYFMNGSLGAATIYAAINTNSDPWYYQFEKTVSTGCASPLPGSVQYSPHPFNMHTTVSAGNDEKIVSVEVYDTNGREVIQAASLNTPSYTFGDALLPGIYIVHLTTEKGIYVKRLIKTE